MQEISERGATSSAPEDLFTELFTQVFGVEKALLLVPQFPVTDIYGAAATWTWHYEPGVRRLLLR
jgi:hypothetical protein